MKKVKIAVVGAGRLGGFHADKIGASTKAELVGVYDPIEANRLRVANKWHVPAFSERAELLEIADAVCVAAPSTDHGKLGFFFLENGKHLLMEKPLAVTATEAMRLKTEAAKRGLVLRTGHVERFNPAWTTVLPTLREMGETGPRVFDAVRTSPYSFRCVDVGAVLDIMIHDLELVLSLVDSPIENVTADGLTELGGHEDSCYASVRFQNGEMARFFASRIEQTPTRVMNVRGRGKRVRVDFAERKAEIITVDPEVLAGRFAPEAVCYAEILPSIPTFMKDHYRTESFEKSPVDALALEEDHFVEAILHPENVAEPDKGAEAVALAEMILDHLKKSRTL